MRDSEKGLGFLLGHEEAETRARRIKEVGVRIKRINRHSYKDTPIAFDPINLNTPGFTPAPTVAPQETPKPKGKLYGDLTRVTNKDDPLLEAAELKKAEMLVSKANTRMVTQLTNLKNWANNSKKVVR